MTAAFLVKFLSFPFPSVMSLIGESPSITIKKYKDSHLAWFMQKN